MNLQAARPRIEMEQLRAPITMPRIGLGTWAIGGWMSGGSDEVLWGARRLEQLAPVREIMGWRIDPATMREIDDIVAASITNPIGPEFMAPPVGLVA